MCPLTDSLHPTKAQVLACVTLLFPHSEEKQEEGTQKMILLKAQTRSSLHSPGTWWGSGPAEPLSRKLGSRCHKVFPSGDLEVQSHYSGSINVSKELAHKRG